MTAAGLTLPSVDLWQTKNPFFACRNGTPGIEQAFSIDVFRAASIRNSYCTHVLEQHSRDNAWATPIPEDNQPRLTVKMLLYSFFEPDESTPMLYWWNQRAAAVHRCDDEKIRGAASDWKPSHGDGALRSRFFMLLKFLFMLHLYIWHVISYSFTNVVF